jgi:CBS domain-containing protein
MDIKSVLKKFKLQRAEDYYIKILLRQVKLKDIMTCPVKSLNRKEPFSNVVKFFNDYNIRHLPIVNDQGQIVGLITQRDLFKIQSPKKLLDGKWYYDHEDLNNLILAQVMTASPFTMKVDDNIGDMIVKMIETKYGCVPIVDAEGILKGIITQYDILGFAAAIFLE